MALLTPKINRILRLKQLDFLCYIWFVVSVWCPLYAFGRLLCHHICS